MTTYDERRARHLLHYDHTHTPNGNTVQRYYNQSAGDDPKCPAECGRTIIIRDHDRKGAGWASNEPNGTPEPWQHAIECSLYEPDPTSIAGQPGYIPGPGRLGYTEPA
ncbi:hypothetical protein [Zhihengliuella halotolerans]|uniref:hypothetical protein n=1 Tax=Zhihengliuella halotolerans TaxID=370736 RepID=UPI000C80CD4E|nr:hypothetical protein [Zhihengliuella halotolerans]